jgi:hypothetical protein
MEIACHKLTKKKDRFNFYISEFLTYSIIPVEVTVSMVFFRFKFCARKKGCPARNSLLYNQWYKSKNKSRIRIPPQGAGIYLRTSTSAPLLYKE